MYANRFAACILLGNVYRVLFTFSGMATSYCKEAILAYFVKCLFLLKYAFFTQKFTDLSVKKCYLF